MTAKPETKINEFLSQYKLSFEKAQARLAVSSKQPYQLGLITGSIVLLDFKR